MAFHHGDKFGKALATKSTSKTTKSKAGKNIANHKASNH